MSSGLQFSNFYISVFRLFRFRCMKQIIAYSFLICVSVLIACSSEEPESNIEVSPQFRPYVRAFEAEAAKRGISFDFEESGLEILLGPTRVDNAAGVCRGDGSIEIEKTVWDNYSDAGKEQLIFHELGHCVLGRPHRNVVLSNNEWGSIMRGSPIPEDRGVVVNYSGQRKEYYIDELFDENTPFPDWAGITRDYQDDVPLDTILMIEEDNELNTSKFIDAGRNFQIEFELDNNGLSRAGFSWGGLNLNNSMYIMVNQKKSFQFSSGFSNDGFLLNFKELDLLNTISNKLTIRKLDNLYYFFINEKFVYWADFVNFSGSNLTTFAINNAGQIEANYDLLIRNLTISYIN